MLFDEECNYMKMQKPVGLRVLFYQTIASAQSKRRHLFLVTHPHLYAVVLLVLVTHCSIWCRRDSVNCMLPKKTLDARHVFGWQCLWSVSPPL